MNDTKIFEQSKWIIEQLENYGHKAFFVGGSVRDFLMNKAISDVDITTSALPDEVESIFDKTLPIGKEHGTIMVISNEQQFEVTTFRKDGDYVDNRRPTSVQFVTDLYEDVARRDFTMNALAMDKNYGIHDYFNGKEDIENHIIKAVGTPLDRMNEDALRIMRGIRFQAQTGFDIEIDTQNAMKDTVHLLSNISIERIIVELKKLISGSYIKETKKTIDYLSIFHHIPFFEQIKNDEIFMPTDADFDLWIGALCFIYKVDTTSLNTLKISNLERKQIIAYVELLKSFSKKNISKQQLTLIVYKYGDVQVKNILNFIKEYHEILNIEYQPVIMNNILIDEIYGKLPIYNKSELNINGQILMTEFNKTGGPWIKHALNQLEEAVVLNKVNNKRYELIEWMREHVEI